MRNCRFHIFHYVVDGGKVITGEEVLVPRGCPAMVVKPNEVKDPASFMVPITMAGEKLGMHVNYRNERRERTVEKSFFDGVKGLHNQHLMTIVNTKTGYGNAVTFQQYLRSLLIDSQYAEQL